MANSHDFSALVMNIYDKDIFVPVFSNIKIDEVLCGGASASLEIDPQKHLSRRGFVQSAVLTALNDVAVKITGASVGALVDTLSFSMNLTRDIPFCKIVKATGVVKHHGRSTMVIASEIKNEDGFLLATALTTMSIEGFFDEIPIKW